jgi:predicted transcriptional regulator
MPRKTSTTTPKKAPASLTKAQGTGDRLKTLEALAAKLAASIDARSSGRDVAALSKQVRDTVSGMDAIRETTATVPDVVGLALKNRRKK